MAKEKTEKTIQASEEQKLYAKILNIGMIIGLVMVIMSFIVYMLGILPSFVPPQDIPKYWSMASKDFIHMLDAPTGWAWLSFVNKGDYLNFVGIALLAGLTILCYAAIVPILMRKKDTPYIIIAIMEVAVLVLAASGILKSGGH